jgi:transposase
LKASEIQESAIHTFCISFAKNALASQVKQIIAQINSIEEQLKELEAEISILFYQTNQVITIITGIDDVLGGIIIGEISYFESTPQLVAYAGLDVDVKQSGEFIDAQTKISKRSSPYLRGVIWLITTV